MPLEQTITIVNNSGKIINNGKQLFSIFTDAKNSYLDKKAEIKQLRRAQTLKEEPRHREVYHDQAYQRTSSRPPLTSRRSYDAQSIASSRHSRRSRSQSRYHGEQTPRSRPPLTIDNLKTHSEISSTTPTRRAVPPSANRAPTQLDDARTMAMTERAPAGYLDRRRSESQMGGQEPQHGTLMRKSKAVDMDLAYGNVPPDLEHLPEYNPSYQDPNEERQAKFLVGKVEGLLGEAECLQSSAGAIIKRLQEDPDAAASVALTLSELSKVVAKMSPAFLGLLKGSSPAVFGLLASPQFLIGTTVLAGVTVVMFGGWKIIQKVKENQQPREALDYHGFSDGRPAPLRTQTEPIADTGYAEALVLDDDISTIESWRRGIPIGDDASADLELITPEADRARREVDDDARSRRSTRTPKSSREAKKSSREKERDVPERRSSRRTENVADGSEAAERRGSRRVAESVAGSERSDRGSSNRKKHSSSSSSASKSESKSKRKETRAIEEGGRDRSSSSRGHELVVRPRGAERNNMLKALFKSKDKERQLVLA